MPRAIRALVFDTNVFGRDAQPDIETVSRWADACKRHDAEMIIPQVVAWELAHHVLEAEEGFQSGRASGNAKRRRWGFAPIPEPERLTVESVLTRLEKAGAVLISLPPDVALEAIRDQVLLIGPATRKGGVKTGAADSAWIRSVFAHFDGDLEGVVIVTGDRSAVEGTARLLAVPSPQVVENLGQIRHLLQEETPADQAQEAGFNEKLSSLFGPDFGIADLRQVVGLAPLEWWDVTSDTIGDGWEHQDSSVSLIEAEVVGGITLDAWSQSLSGNVRVRLAVEETYARQDDWGDYPEYRARTYEAWIDATLTFYLEGGQVTANGTLEQPQLGVHESSVFWQSI